MKSVYLSAIFFAILSVVACNKEGVTSTESTLQANAYISSATRTSYKIGNYGEKVPVKVSWDANESFKAYYEGGKSPVTFSKTAEGTSFMAESVPEGVSAATSFKGLYGSKATLDADGKISIDFSAQNGSQENLSAYDVMSATSELNNGVLSFAFKHNCAILRLKCVNHTINQVNKVRLIFSKAKVSDEFAGTGIIEGNSGQVTLSITLKTPVEAGSAVKDKGSVGYRYVIVPAIKYRPEGKGIFTFGSFDSFEKMIDISETKSVEAGKVYDVLCDCGVEGDENGMIWGD